MSLFWLCYGEYRGSRRLKPFMRYFLSKIQEYADDRQYRIYITDSLRALIGNDSNTRWADIVDRTPPDTRTPDEVIENIKRKLKGE